MYKTCYKCKTEKPLSEFPHKSYCRPCMYEYTKQYRRNNPGKTAQYVANWRRLNPEGHKAVEGNRRARLLLATGRFTKEEWKDLLLKTGNKCQHCGNFGHMSVDHIIPLSRSGSNDILNIQPLCKPCNSRKNNKLESELAYLGGG